jgi:hypothetical protein
MENSDELLLLSLNHTELRTLLAMRHLADRRGLITATMEELGEVTGYGRESLRLAIRGLETRGLIDTTRTKRNFGKLYKNQYRLPLKNLASELPEILASTPDKLTNTVNDSKVSSSINTSYLLGNASVPEEKTKEISLATLKRWQPEGENTDGDDEIGGIGLFEDEKPAAVKKKFSVDKRDPKTRNRRPQAEWGPYDIAAEFSFRIGRKFPYTPGLINVRNLGGALSKIRSEYQTNALLELEVMEIWMGDDRNLRMADDRPDLLYRAYLKALTIHMGKAIENLDMDEDFAEVDAYLTATDGHVFDNSRAGRKLMEKYEAKLKGE